MSGVSGKVNEDLLGMRFKSDLLPGNKVLLDLWG